MTTHNYSTPPQPPIAFTDTTSSIKEATARLNATTKALLDHLVATIKPEDATFENVILPIVQDQDERIIAGGVLDVYQKVSADPDLRAASSEASEVREHFVIDKGMRQDVFRLVEAVYQRNEELDPESAKLLREMRTDYVRDGLALPDAAARERLGEIKKRLSSIGLEFSRNVDENKGCVYFSKEQLDGVPDGVLEGMEKGSGEFDGMYKVTFKDPEFGPVMRLAHDPETRRKASVARANQCPQNAPIFREAICLRAEAAQLIGYPSHAAFVLERKMAKTPEAVQTFLEDILARALRSKDAEIAGLLQVKQRIQAERGLPVDPDLFSWDLAYYARHLTQEHFFFDGALIAEFFPVLPTTAAMLALFGRLLGFVFVELDEPERARLSPTGRPADLLWHPDARAYAVWDTADEGAAFVGYLYLDLHPRPGKHSHAQCHAVQLGFRRPGGRTHYPSTALIANFTKPTADGGPGLLRHREVVMLFHELGHGMHDLAGRSRFARFFGANTVGDFNEAPSQMLENWCWDPVGLRALSGHYVTGEKMGEELVAALLKARHVNAALGVLGQLRLSLFDLMVHCAPAGEDGKVDVQGIYEKYRDMSGIKTVDPSEVPHPYSTVTFGWLVAGSGVSYYNYHWSNVAAMDMFNTAFKKDPMDGVVGRRYRHMVLEKGGSLDEMVTVTQFLGREPKSDAFFEDLGLE